jgi:DNA-binding MarR family transcriptional regulator
MSEPTLPLARLLLLAHRQLVDGLHEQLRERGWKDVRESYGFVLLATRGTPTTTTDLAALLGVSKQATSKLLDAMEASRYVQRTADPDDARMKVVALAPRGHELLAVVEAIYAELEGEWDAAVGPKALGQVRATLTDVVLAGNDGVLPEVRPSGP